jgi:glucosamine--fructose-6-phosphate aminotransferase (isomerizing)
MSRHAMLDNIFDQPDSLRSLVGFHRGASSTLNGCADRLRSATGRLIFTGMGASLFAAMPAVGHLVQHGYRALAVESAELLHYGAASLRSDDIAILISRSGGSVEVLRLAEKMRAAGAAIVAVTNVPDSELQRASDASLLIGSQPDQLIAVQTYTGTVLALLLLAEQVIHGDATACGEQCLGALPALAGHIEQCYRLSETWQDWLDAHAPLYLLGRGPSIAAAHEGALLLHETAKAPAVAMSSGQFRHGPVEAVSSDFRAVVFGAPEATRHLDRSLANDLVRMGANIRWNGPASEEPEESAGAPPLSPWPITQPQTLLAPIFEIVPLQFAAYRLALWRGIVPGDFRYASEITAAESGFPLFQSRLTSA